jgi:predicted enzyme related to lactoylglutathione lyase
MIEADVERNAARDEIGRFCWLDLAATHAAIAKRFYERLFGWTPQEQAVGDVGAFTRLQLGGRDVGSLYQLREAHIDYGVPSHWTPYIRVDDVEETARRAVACGGQVTVKPFAIEGMARIALIVDAVGAPVGLWQPLCGNQREGDERG